MSQVILCNRGGGNDNNNNTDEEEATYPIPTIYR